MHGRKEDVSTLSSGKKTVSQGPEDRVQGEYQV